MGESAGFSFFDDTKSTAYRWTADSSPDEVGDAAARLPSRRRAPADVQLVSRLMDRLAAGDAPRRRHSIYSDSAILEAKAEWTRSSASTPRAGAHAPMLSPLASVPQSVTNITSPSSGGNGIKGRPRSPSTLSWTSTAIRENLGALGLEPRARNRPSDAHVMTEVRLSREEYDSLIRECQQRGKLVEDLRDCIDRTLSQPQHPHTSHVPPPVPEPAKSFKGLNEPASLQSRQQHSTPQANNAQSKGARIHSWAQQLESPDQPRTSLGQLQSPFQPQKLAQEEQQQRRIAELECRLQRAEETIAMMRERNDHEHGPGLAPEMMPDANDDSIPPNEKLYARLQLSSIDRLCSNEIANLLKNILIQLDIPYNNVQQSIMEHGDRFVELKMLREFAERVHRELYCDERMDANLADERCLSLMLEQIERLNIRE